MDPKALFDFFRELSNGIFGNKAGSIILSFSSVLVFVYIVLWFIAKTKELISNIFIPLFYKPEERRLAERRRRFAEHIESEIKRLNRLEDWTDYHYTELEAEVEAEGDWRKATFIPFLMRTYSGLRMEKSLSKALGTSKERRILLQGEPGAGKSVALRHIALTMSQIVAKHANLKKVIPIYVNLKELHRKSDQAVDRILIHQFILASLNRVNDRDIEEFLAQNFDKGLENGTWLFLFDSFDEIPEVLGATNSDKVVRDYSQAISDFLHGMNQCRGIVASRHFRGPDRGGWPVFTILTLTDTRKKELIRRAELGKSAEKLILNGLVMAPPSVTTMSVNPMFMGLLCDHVKQGNTFPDNVHAVFEAYINSRLQRDSARLKVRFGISHEVLRETAEYVAFTMAADEKLGLSPNRSDLHSAMKQMGFTVDALDNKLNALEYIKLARTEVSLTSSEKLFTFAHRRFQEYFSTCVLLRDPQLVNPHKLLMDGRWREATVTLLQVRSLSQLPHIVAETDVILDEITNKMEELIEAPIDYLQTHKQANIPHIRFISVDENFHHLANLLQEGLNKRTGELPETIINKVSQILLTIFELGPMYQRQLALECAGVANQQILVHILKVAFGSQSRLLKDIAYRQSARLVTIPAEISRHIKRSIMHMESENMISKHYFEIQAQVSRFDAPEMYLNFLDHIKKSRNIIYYMLLIFIAEAALVLLPAAYVAIRGFNLSTMTNIDFIVICILILLALWWGVPLASRYFYINYLIGVDYAPPFYDRYIFRFTPSYLNLMFLSKNKEEEDEDLEFESTKSRVFIAALAYLGIALLSAIILFPMASLVQNQALHAFIMFLIISGLIYVPSVILLLATTDAYRRVDFQEISRRFSNRSNTLKLLNGKRMEYATTESILQILRRLDRQDAWRAAINIRKNNLLKADAQNYKDLVAFSVKLEEAYNRMQNGKEIRNAHPHNRFVRWLLPKEIIRYLRANRVLFALLNSYDEITGMKKSSITIDLLDELNLLLENMHVEIKANNTPL